VPGSPEDSNCNFVLNKFNLLAFLNLLDEIDLPGRSANLLTNESRKRLVTGLIARPPGHFRESRAAATFQQVVKPCRLILAQTAKRVAKTHGPAAGASSGATR